MIIQSVKAENFRGIYKERSFEFKNNRFVLLFAENGIGKTTLLDAIEWCLTGNIGRLRTAYDLRSTNSEERQENLDGILKNRNAKPDEQVKVILGFEYENHSYIITRTQKTDELNASKSKLMIKDSEGKTEDASFLNQIINRNFYNYHYCDVQKSFNIQNTQRGKLSDLFSDFISDYQREETVAHNLKVFREDVDRKIQDNERKLEKLNDDFYSKTNQQHSLEGNLELLPYNQILMFEDEQLDLLKLNIDQLTIQMGKLYSCGYSSAYEKLGTLENSKKAEQIYGLLQKLAVILSEKSEKIQEAVRLKLNEEDNSLAELQKQCDKYKGMRMTNENYTELANEVISLGENGFTMPLYVQAQGEVEAVSKQIQDLDEEIAMLDNGNGIIETLSLLAGRKKEIVSLKNELKLQKKTVKCPICGSEQFGSIQDSSVLEEAEKYLVESNKAIADKSKLRSELAEKKKSIQRQIVDAGNVALQQGNLKIKNSLERLLELKSSTVDFFEVRDGLARVSPGSISVEEMQNKVWVMQEADKYQASIMDAPSIEKVQKEISEILNLIGYNQNDDNSWETTRARIESSAKDAPIIKQFDVSILTEKINAIKSAKNNNENLRLGNELRELGTQIETLKKENAEMKVLEDKADRRAEEIMGTVNLLKKAEYDGVGPYLFKFYKKLARINNIQNIQVSIEGDKISLKDDNGKNIVNVLSNGQLSVFMLSFFFGGIVSRGAAEKCKIYFIDDLTACMDDINMLNFLDTLKYQLVSNQLMEQVFFSTCDDKIGRLIKYKLKGCGIKYAELGEKVFLV